MGYLLKTNEFPIQPTNRPTNQPTNQPTKQPTNGNQYFQIETQIFDTFPKQPGHFPPPKKKITASGEPASQRMVRGLRRSLCGVNSLYQSLGCIFLVEVFRDQMVEMARVDFILLGLRINHEGWRCSSACKVRIEKSKADIRNVNSPLLCPIRGPKYVLKRNVFLRIHDETSLCSVILNGFDWSNCDWSNGTFHISSRPPKSSNL